ncbi:FG-GAP-like repeat-containing protein [Aestuariicoccus sp. MJ-SS9]|uniref:FG-GAP-like repeat-containing protein n=1 Tax=Aestuariicoccus sp. MJ-SS9 TaxID=3079855 RepID=UPI0029062DFA|nr:FG-GAP-like repeat-containing protein [Aestuariicoccus sp. MJ-SS9]MDU8912165.1 FG-GAP-like repeat-containing protein [Aestuariicoccus sp. MJ-SS9]
MSSIVTPPFQKRFFLAMLIVGVLAYLFWTGSRYPALNEKAMMSGAIQLEDALSFEARFPIDPDMGLVERIFWSTLNWINTNKKGMTFGVLFAAAFLTAAGYLRRKSFEGSFSNSFLGLVIGTPLGVCVNCAAPIARGMYTSGLRAETTLSAMIASPTLNVVVLTMLFSLLPVYMAVLKIALSLVIILLAVPLIARVLPRTEIEPEKRIQTPWSGAELAAGQPAAEGLHVAVWEVARAYAANLWYIFKMTVPLMILAGFLGTVAAVLLPADAVLGMEFALWLLLAVALVGLFLPVPIGFDVVMAGALLAAGMTQGYVMALLFTLGSFSVYSFFIVAQSVGRRAAWLLAGAVFVAGVGGGWGAQAWHDYQSDRALKLLLGEAPAPRLPWAAEAAGAPGWQVTSDDAARISIAATPFRPRTGAGGFTRMEAWQAGIDKPVEFSMDDMWPPFWEGRSLASSDIDNDGDMDLAIASTEAGLYLYANDGSGGFARIEADLGALADMPVFNAALADIDNDGWRDLLIATYRQGIWLWRNQGGAFTGAPQPVANRDGAVLAMALSLGDPDRDGDLDVALGNWTAGWYRRVPGEESRNRILWNQSGVLDGSDFTDLPGIPGETLSILFADIDRDGAADLLVGNDFEIPDYIYRGDGAGGFTAITHGDGVVPHVTTTTMAIKVADLMNDGSPEIYLAQIAGRSSGVSSKLKMQPLERYCDSIEDARARTTCATNMGIKTWYRSGNNFDPTYASECQKLTGSLQAECKGMLVKDLAIQRHDPGICALIPTGQDRAHSFCDLHFLPTRSPTPAEADAGLRQVLRANVLLEREGEVYADTATDRGLEVGGWSWDTKVADFDQDGWQDVYIVNGTWVPNEVSPSNMYFRARGDGTFTEASGEAGLEDYLMTAAATAFDMDGDGDLDMLTHPVNGPLALFRNDGVSGNALAIALEDMAGNRDGIGAVVTVTDDLGVTRSREIQLGGGFMSFDAPVAHFGMGTARGAQSVTIRWADGAETAIAGPLEAGASYRVTRAAP